MRRAWLHALLLLIIAPGLAEAADGCSLIKAGSAWTLAEDCTTDASIVLPDGVTLDGAHHTIVAVDPAGALFRGGVIVAGGASANVVNTVITALMLADACQVLHDRLRGIYFNGASGLIQGNTILNVHKGGSSCQEGNAVEIRNADLAGATTSVEVIGNVIDGFQKTGIVASGNVDVTVRGNSIGASAAQRWLVANGIQAGAGARALIESNTIAGNSSDGDDAATAVLLVNTGAGTLVRGNAIVGNADVGIYVMANGVRVERNRLNDSGADGTFDVGIGNYGNDNVFEGNSITGFDQRYQNVADPRAGKTTVAAR
jgi:hypothetical protein